MEQLQKIVIIGPESTGKSTLSSQLANHYNTLWCEEYARQYLMQHGKDYTYADLLHIAKGQVALEEKTMEAVADNRLRQAQKYPPLVFMDTDLYVIKVWSEFVYHRCHQWILDQIAVRRYDLYLLCDTDLPWVKDELREYPDPGTRKELYRIYRNLMVQQSVPWVEISGGYEQRFEKAKKAIEEETGF
ncbi:MAG: ATP-binding protein [Chitinophagaceae bacterium]|nr:ATP-binding protein [Chitinophagaceae bacterium]